MPLSARLPMKLLYTFGVPLVSTVWGPVEDVWSQLLALRASFPHRSQVPGSPLQV